jgi:hypothetical protein
LSTVFPIFLEKSQQPENFWEAEKSGVSIFLLEKSQANCVTKFGTPRN